MFCYWQCFLPYSSHYLIVGRIEISIICHKVIKKFWNFFWKSILMLAERRWDFWSKKSCFWFSTNFTYKISMCSIFMLEQVQPQKSTLPEVRRVFESLKRSWLFWFLDDFAWLGVLMKAAFSGEKGREWIDFLDRKRGRNFFLPLL